MRLYSTNNRSKFVSLKEAVMKGLPEDNGLFMPEVIPQLPASFFEKIREYSFKEIGFKVCKALFQSAIPEEAVRQIIHRYKG